MKVNQLHTLLNSVTTEVLGKDAVIKEDLSNVVSIGKNIVDTDNVDNYVKKLVNQIGKIVFVDRLYKGGVPSVLMDSWEYGSILEKISAELPVAHENDSWKLEDGTDYNPNVFYQPKVSAKFFNSKVTFEIPLSFTERQVKESFQSEAQLNGFVSMLTTSVENAMTVKLDALIMRTINNMTAETLVKDLGPDLANVATGGVKAINLLARFNKMYAQKLTADKAVTNPDFIRFATYQIGLTSDRMSKISTLFNVEGKERFTPVDNQNVVLLSEFAKASETFLRADLFNVDKVVLPDYDSVPYWQGSGTDYSFSEVSKIDVKTSNGNNVSLTGILGVIFDRNALGVTNLDRRVTTNYNPKAEFYTNFYKFDAGYYNDLNENMVVFYVA